MTDAGPMRESITIQQRTTSQDGAGEPLLTWSTVATRRAEKMATPGREVWGANQRSARVPTVFRIRFPKDLVITPKMRVLHLGTVFDITSCVDADGRRVDMLLTCEELVAEVA